MPVTIQTADAITAAAALRMDSEENRTCGYTETADRLLAAAVRIEAVLDALTCSPASRPCEPQPSPTDPDPDLDREPMAAELEPLTCSLCGAQARTLRVNVETGRGLCERCHRLSLPPLLRPQL